VAGVAGQRGEDALDEGVVAGVEEDGGPEAVGGEAEPGEDDAAGEDEEGEAREIGT